MEMKTGVTELVLSADWSFDEVLQNISATGYEALELALRDQGYCSFAADEKDLAGLPEAARGAGIELVSMCPAQTERPKDLMTNDTTLREAARETVIDYMRVANAVGVETVLIVLGQLPPDLGYEEAYDNALDSMRRLAPAAEMAGVNLAIEYVWNKFLLSPLEFCQFLDEVDSPRVGFYFDPGNMCAFSYPKQWLRLLSDHLMAVHMKDFKRDGFEWVPLGEGDVDFPGVMAELHSTGYEGALVSEVSQGVASLEESAKEIDRIKEL